MEVIGAVVGGLMSCLCSSNGATRSVAKVCKHVISPTKEIESLRNKFAELIARKNDVKRRLHSDEVVEGKTSTDDAKHWLEVVEKVLTKINVVEHQVEEAKTCLKGLFPDCCSRSKLGHCISNLTIEVVGLCEKGGHFLDGSLPLSSRGPIKGTELPTTRLVGKTAEKNIEMVWERLLNPGIGTIGVYGMGGTGKTSIIKEINNRLIKEHLFDKVIWVTVSKDASVKKIQNHIGKALELGLSNDDEVYRSASLLDSLKRHRKFLLILDDMWEEFSLHVIGIPTPTKENGCKILLTSRPKDVCKRMGCHDNNIIKVNLLSKEDAWELFMDKVGVHLGDETKEIAKDVVKECAYLPLAIITIGGVMQGNNNISEWRVTLKHLRESSYQIPNMEENVFKCLLFSYERLVDEQIKSCFLYCALYPEDWMIKEDELVDWWIVEGLIRENSRQSELDKGHLILNKLKHHCLLESGIDWCGIVKMHDLIREMTLYITKGRFIVEAGSLLEEIENEEEWGEDLERASLMSSAEVKIISVTPKCSKLSTIFFNEMGKLNNMPRDFFVHMKGLKVLNLEGSSKIAMLPDSISDLVDLRALCLSGCWKIKQVPSLAKLTLLRTLKLDGTGIKELPHGMEMLVNLKCLNLSRLGLRQKFPIGLIPKWTLLEGLSLFLEPRLYKVERDWDLVEELVSLKHLEALSFNFICSSQFTRYIRSPTFKSLKMSDLGIGADSARGTYFEGRNIDIGQTDSPVNALIIPQNTESLELKEFNNLMSLNQLSTKLSELGCLELRKCTIRYCQNMEYVLWFSQGGKNEDCVVLPCLAELVILGCSKLQSLCKGIPTPGTLLYLKNLSFSDCHNMKNVFSSSRLLELLQHLEEIEVRFCDEMKELIASSSSSSSEEEEDITSIRTISLPKLKNLTLYCLPKLKSILKGEMICDSLERLSIRHCDELKKLPQLSVPSLKEIIGRSQQWWDSLEWDDDDDHHPSLRCQLQPLFYIHPWTNRKSDQR